MSDKCPFCGEPATRHINQSQRDYRCGTRGPYFEDGEETYSTGRVCDQTTYLRLIERLLKERDEAREAARWLYEAAKWLQEAWPVPPEPHLGPVEDRWPWLADDDDEVTNDEN